MDNIITVFNTLQPLTTTITWYSTFILCMSVGATLLCYYFKIEYEMRLDLIGLAVVFPLVFSVNSAFQRREQALQHLAAMKANAYSIRFSFYHLCEGQFLSSSAPKEIDAVLLALFKKNAEYFKSDEFLDSDYMQIMAYFSTISWLVEVHLRRGGVSAPTLTRLDESLRTIMAQFENLRVIKLYRTPLALRAYTKLFVGMFPILFAPLFAFLAESRLWGAIIMVILYSVVLTGLDAIQDGLEEPFDGLGIDDIKFGEYSKHMSYPVITPGHKKLRIEDSGGDTPPRMFVKDLDDNNHETEFTGGTVSAMHEQLQRSSTIEIEMSSRDSAGGSGVDSDTKALVREKTGKRASRMANLASD